MLYSFFYTYFPFKVAHIFKLTIELKNNVNRSLYYMYVFNVYNRQILNGFQYSDNFLLISIGVATYITDN